ncbi:MBL fold metallo-hydrolase [Bacillus sp. FJAT-47783]|uniref:YtnP family quorum-quenching lactonase n=1 Tax=Bacillus sp. FJAT-47783 TaxID=2922712 RepID=UPI001FAD5601|nr:MBL fold metallo-hydrolase [Bacillus sp. FJAT-47783]
MESLKVGNFQLTWLNGGNVHLDGGAMFGVVPKLLWSKKYPVNDRNQIPLRCDPILVQKDGTNILIETGIGKDKMNEKLKRNFGVKEESNVEASLKELGLTLNDINYVLLTHCHFDHTCGVTKWENGELVSTFPHAKILTSNIEWEEMKSPNIRSKSTYWKDNWEPIEKQVETYEHSIEVIDGITMIHTGGHSHGHSIIVIEDGDEQIVHLADLMPTHAHQNALWVMAYDDYPMDSIYQKQKWIPTFIQKNAWFTFYHDAIYRAVKWNEQGELIETIKREEKQETTV